MIFKASLDRTAQILTIGIAVFFMVLYFVTSVYANNGNDKYSLIIMGGILLLIYGITYALHPTSYEVKKDEVVINRPLQKISIQRSQISHFVKIEDGSLKWAIRTFGVGGLFGYFGQFWNKEFGSMTWYASRRDRAIMIHTIDNKKIVITPDETDIFIQEMQT